MGRTASFLFVFPVVLVLLGLPLEGGRARAEEKPAADPLATARTDFYGDPLPPGALARMGSVRLRLGERCRQILFSADSKELISVGSDSVIHFWDPETGRELRNLTVEGRAFEVVAVSPDGKTLAAGAADADVPHSNPLPWDWVYLWDAKTHEERKVLHVEGMGAHCLAFSPDGKTLATAGNDKIIRLWDVESDKERVKLEGHKWPIVSVAFSPDGSLLAARDEGDGPEPPKPQDRKHFADFRMWDVEAGKTCWKSEFPGDAQWIGDVYFLPAGEVLAIRFDGLRVLNAKEGKELRVVNAGLGASDRVFLIPPDGKNTIGIGHVRGKDGFSLLRTTIEVLDLAGETGPEFLDGDFGRVYLMALSPDGKTLATVEPLGGESDITRLWNWKTRRQKEIPPGHIGTVNELSFSPDGKTIMTGGSDGTVRFWNAVSGKELRRLGGDKERLNLLAASPDGTVLAARRLKQDDVTDTVQTV